MKDRLIIGLSIIGIVIVGYTIHIGLVRLNEKNNKKDTIVASDEHESKEEDVNNYVENLKKEDNEKSDEPLEDEKEFCDLEGDVDGYEAEFGKDYAFLTIYGTKKLEEDIDRFFIDSIIVSISNALEDEYEVHRAADEFEVVEYTNTETMDMTIKSVSDGRLFLISINRDTLGYHLNMWEMVDGKKKVKYAIDDVLY